MQAWLWKMSEKRNYKILLLCTILCAVFLIFCFFDKIQSDFIREKWQSVSKRLFWITLVSIFLAWRMKFTIPLSPLRNVTFFRGLLSLLVFLSVIFYPLLTNLPFLSQSYTLVKQSIVANSTSKKDKFVLLAKNFPREYDKFISEHFKLTEKFIHLNALIKIYVFGISPNNKIAYGENGFFFEGYGAEKVEKGIIESFDNIADYMGQIPFSPTELRQWKRVLEERHYWLRNQGIDYVFVLAPTKAMVYPENLPSRLQNVTQGVTRYKQLSDFIRSYTNIHFIDLLPALLKAKEERSYPLLFYKTDFHWNFYGAFIAYQSITSELQKFFPQYALGIPQFSDFELSVDKKWAHQRFMYMVGLPATWHKNEHYIKMVPKKGGKYDSVVDLPPDGIYDVDLPVRPLQADNGQQRDFYLILNPKAEVRSIALLGDSFLEKCTFFFSANAQRVLNYRTIVNFPAEIFDFEKPDIVIQEILNMFILRPPPQNPPHLSSQYLQTKFSESTLTVASKGQDELSFCLNGQENCWMLFDALPASTHAGEERTGRVTFSQDAKCNPRLHYTEENGVVQEINSPEILEQEQAITFSLPPTPIKQLTFSVSGTEKARCAPQSVQIHSDLSPKSQKHIMTNKTLQ